MEFELIRRHFEIPFAQLSKVNAARVVTGIGDDCAVLNTATHHNLYVSTDTLVENVHFFADDPAHTVGWKSLACNLSDLAACGAVPLGFTLNLSLPATQKNKPDENWLAGFSTGLLELAIAENCPLLGGDTTWAGNNPGKTISITVFGQAPAEHRGFHRGAAQKGDEVWVSGVPGLACLGLLLQYQRKGKLSAHCSSAELMVTQRILSLLPNHLKENACKALQQPTPRIHLGGRLHGLANACIDLSDGLAGDLAHIAKLSGLSANLSANSIEKIWIESWPELTSFSDCRELVNQLVQITLQGGDDFELCWTANTNYHQKIQAMGALFNHSSNCSLHCIGALEAGEGVWLIQPSATRIRLTALSHCHFSEPEH